MAFKKYQNDMLTEAEANYNEAVVKRFFMNLCCAIATFIIVFIALLFVCGIFAIPLSILFVIWKFLSWFIAI